MNYENFELLVDKNTKLTAKEILDVLSEDLTAVDISLIAKNFDILDSIEKESDFFFELTVLCRDKTYSHPEWGLLSGRVKMLYIKKTTPRSFRESCQMLKPVLDKEYYEFCLKHSDFLENMIDKKQGLDWTFDIFAVETLNRGYLARVKDVKSVIHLAEIPQYLYLRIAAFLWYPRGADHLSEKIISQIKQTYIDLSLGKISPPSPLQFNAGMKKPQLASCFLLSVEDSMASLSKSWHDSAVISMNNGGIGMVFDSVRHSEIGNNGWSEGVTPWIKIVNEVLATVNQSGKRKGSGAMYITDWHRDIFEFVDLKDPLGKDELRARDLFYGIMVSDLFMNRVSKDEMWSVFCPAKSEGLEKTYGKDFEAKYLALEQRGLNGEFPHTFRQVKARELWQHILKSQITTGLPYIIYKDAVNRKNNQKNLGTIRTSNLCTEIMEYVDSDNIASCNLSSIPVSSFVKFRDEEKKKDPYFDFEELGEVTRRALRNLKQVIDRNYYPDEVPQIKYTNFRNRPIGIGIQDLAGCFALMDFCWDSIQAKQLNEKIARVMYYHGMDENVKMAEEFGPYETFQGSPASKGLFQFDLWSLEEFEKRGQTTQTTCRYALPCKDFEWNGLRLRMVSEGLYFSLLFAQMPTASSAQIRGNNESIEPYTQLLFARTVLSGQFVICVPHFVRDLEEIGLWNDKMLKHLFANQGSIQTFPEEDLNPSVLFRLQYLKLKYKTAFELSQKVTTNLYLDRARYQCQSSSNNVFMKNPKATNLSAYHFHMWRGGAKTGSYYVRQTAGSDPLNFSMDNLHVTTRKSKNDEQNGVIECLSCHS
jgi:ribonucleoside-diphosphate reductase alpha subunit